MRLGIIIPAFNAGSRLHSVLTGVKKYTKNIVVINDGSTDNTQKIALNDKVPVLSHLQNLGKGGALKSGFAYALNAKWELVITLDADGQHDPSFIPYFIDAYRITNDAIIIGSRMTSLESMPFHRILSNKITSGLVGLLSGIRVLDSQSGYRLIHSDVLKTIKLHTSRYETETEILIKSGLKGFRCSAINISTIYNGEPSSMHLVKDTLRFIKLYFKCLYEY
ncbi:glycosyltransferase family 2 protein [candidate division KSB1 bacterium]|nr:glycosyltransferase family 2 protein [candidate division KSB1 bacterium]